MDGENHVLTCPLCLQADESEAMAELEIETHLTQPGKKVSICRPCVLRVIRAAVDLNPQLTLEVMNDDHRDDRPATGASDSAPAAAAAPAEVPGNSEGDRPAGEHRRKPQDAAGGSGE